MADKTPQPITVYDDKGRPYTVAGVMVKTEKQKSDTERLEEQEERFNRLEAKTAEINQVLFYVVIVLIFMLGAIIVQWQIANNEMIRYNNALEMSIPH